MSLFKTSVSVLIIEAKICNRSTPSVSESKSVQNVCDSDSVSLSLSVRKRIIVITLVHPRLHVNVVYTIYNLNLQQVQVVLVRYLTLRDSRF